MTQFLNTAQFIHLLFLLMLSTQIQAQVSDDFESGTTANWTSEGDGALFLSPNFGNPGASITVDDNATGDINYSFAPAKYLGDWLTNVTPSDSISLDIYVDSSDPDLITDIPIFQILGPGGRATALDGVTVPTNQWNRIKVSLDSTEWVIEEGNWEAILSNVTQLRIRSEYIVGGEDVYLDNVLLSISPVRFTFTDTICSTFEDSTFEGWNFEDAGALTIDTAFGNPGLGIEIRDRSSVLSQAIAPAKFYGDWTALLDSGYLSFDLNIDNRSNGSLLDKPYLVRLSGNGAVAEVRPPDSILNLAIDQWYTFTFLIDSSVWTMQSGTWDSLITSVQEVRLEFEFILGNERASFDNFCLVPRDSPTTRTDEWKTQPAVQLAPNPANGFFTAIAADAPIQKITLYDLRGRLIPSSITYSAQEARVSTSYQGLTIVQIETTKGILNKKILLQ